MDGRQTKKRTVHPEHLCHLPAPCLKCLYFYSNIPRYKTIWILPLLWTHYLHSKVVLTNRQTMDKINKSLSAHHATQVTQKGLSLSKQRVLVSLFKNRHFLGACVFNGENTVTKTFCFFYIRYMVICVKCRHDRIRTSTWF